MMYYYAMNRSAQYLGKDNLWHDTWNSKIRLDTAIPKYDTKVIGYHEIFEITEYEAGSIPSGERILKPQLAVLYIIRSGGKYFSKSICWHDMSDWNASWVATFTDHEDAVNYAKSQGLEGYIVFAMKYSEFNTGESPKDAEPMAKRSDVSLLKYGLTQAQIEAHLLDPVKLVSPSKREEFFAEYGKLCEKFKIPPFRPNVRYNAGGDQLEVYLTDEASYCDPVGPTAPGIMIMREFNTKFITGVKIQCFLERIAGADPSRHAMIMDLEMVHVICKLFERFMNENGSAFTWTPEELEFFKKVHKLWPGMPYKFLEELP